MLFEFLMADFFAFYGDVYMRNSIILVVMFFVSASTLAFNFSPNGVLIDTLTQDQIRSDATLVIRSLNSNICHSIKGGYRDLVNIKYNSSGAPENVYKDLNSCLNDEGIANKYENQVLSKEDPEALQEKESTEKKAEIANEYNGLNFGGGIMFASYSDEIVLDATIESGTVSVNHEIKNRAVAMLESHYFFTPGEKNIFGYGPFIGIGLAGEDGVDPLSIYGVGVMVGFRKPNESTSWNIGLGYFIDSEAKILKNGLKNGSPTEESDSAKIMAKDDVGGVMLMFSQSF